MSWMDRLRGSAVAGMSEGRDLAVLEQQLAAERSNNEHLTESLADLEADNRGWLRLEEVAAQLQFTRQGVQEIAARARLNYLANPLIKRAVNVRTFYTWGQGVEISGRDDKVNEVVQAFLDDPLNQQVLFGHDGRQDKDRALQLDANLFLALVTDPVSGAVQVRSIPWVEISTIIRNPQDREDRWYYIREWTATVIDPVTGAISTAQQRQFYPALGYRPPVGDRPAQIGDATVNWDSPVLHLRVGGLDGMDYGVSEVYAALSWARAFKGFLEDWASLAKALSKYAWKATAKPGRVATVKAKLEESSVNSSSSPYPNRASGAGQAIVSDGTTDLSAINKTGATVDAESGRPLAMMVAAAMDIPYTILMGDPDIGNLATAKTLDRPTELAMQSRREMWAGVYRQILSYVIDQAILSPRGPLTGQRTQEGTREIAVIAGDVDRNLDIEFPSILEHNVLELVEALHKADDTGHVPAKIICRLLLTALGVENVDEVMEDLVDADGNFLDPGLEATVNAGAEAVRQFRAGEQQPPA